MRAVRVAANGGPEVLVLQEGVDTPPLSAGHARVRIAAAGVNFIDVYQRTGYYTVPLPYTPGVEGAGTVEAVGPGVTDLREGDRVAFAGVPGSYAETVDAPAEKLVPVPEAVPLETAAAAMLQGMTAHYLTHATVRLRAGQTCLLHAAAGGTGQLVAQMAKSLGARVIGTVSTEEKARLAREAGCDEVVNYATEDFAGAVGRLTGGRGVDVVYDSVGKATVDGSLACLAPLGMLVLFGQSSGPVPPIDPGRLARGSHFLTRPSLFHYVADRASLLERSSTVLEAVASGRLRIRIQERLPLARAADAHRRLESRSTTGKVLLVP